MADSRISLPPENRRGEPIEVRISIRHPMETGYRVDDLGKPILDAGQVEDIVSYLGSLK